MKKIKSSISHNKWNLMDKQISETFCEIGEHIEVSDYLKGQIDRRVLEESIKEEHYMKRFSVKKTVIGVAAACLIVGTVSIAGSGLKGYISSMSSIPSYTKFEDMEKAENQLGYQVDAVDTFSNGYTLKGIHIGDVSIVNEAGQTEGSAKEIAVDYKKGQDRISLNAYQLLSGENPETALDISSADQSIQCDDITVVYREITNKFVPPDYELTEEDKKNMENDNYNLSFGTNQVEINKSSHASWIKDGVMYGLMGFDLSISADEMLNMAKEVIESEN